MRALEKRKRKDTKWHSFKTLFLFCWAMGTEQAGISEKVIQFS